MSNFSETIRKAAILISVLDRDSADALLDQMDSHQAALVRNAVIELDDIPADEQRQVVDEFLRIRKPAPLSASPAEAAGEAEDDGVELQLSGSTRDDSSAANATGEPPEPASAAMQATGTPASSAVGAAVPSDLLSPFQFLRSADGNVVAQLLANEHPQTIAVVLAHLPPKHAAAVLGHLSVATQTEVIRRMVDREETDPAILRDVEATLEIHFAQQLRSFQRREHGVAAMQSILDATEQPTRNAILTNLSASDAELAARLTMSPTAASPVETTGAHDASTPEGSFPARKLTGRDVGWTLSQPESAGAGGASSGAAPAPHSYDPPWVEMPDREKGTLAGQAEQDGHESPADQDMLGAEEEPAVRVEFDDLMRLDDRSLGVVLHAADPRTTMLALAGASDQLVHRILRQLPARKARILQRQIEQQGPLRLRDIEAAQQSLSHLAGQLAARGLLHVPTAKGFAVAA